jgi:hypothetical protein
VRFSVTAIYNFATRMTTGRLTSDLQPAWNFNTTVLLNQQYCPQVCFHGWLINNSYPENIEQYEFTQKE